MRRVRLFLSAVILLNATMWQGTRAHAQGLAASTVNDAQATSELSHAEAKPEKRLDHLSKRYKLNDDQKKAILPILKDERAQVQALRTDSNLSHDEQLARVASIHADHNSQIEAILDNKQQEKWQKDRDKHREF